MRTPRATPEVTLVGAGLAGSLLAIFLARRGQRVTLLERRPDPRKTPAGAPGSAGRSINLALANRGIAALEEVGVMEKIRPTLIPMAGRMLHDEEGRLKLIPYGNKPHEVIYSARSRIRAWSTVPGVWQFMTSAEVRHRSSSPTS